MKRAWVAFVSVAVLLASTGSAGWAQSSPSVAGSSLPKITGCNAKGHITFFHWGDKNTDNGFKAAIRAAEKACPGLTVEDQWDQGNYDVDIKTKIGSGNAPDLFMLDGAKRIAQYASQGALANLDTFVKRDKMNLKKTYVPQCLPQMQYKKHNYGLMLSCSDQQLLFYNKDMFNARHVKFPTNNWTYKDFRSAAIKLSGNYSVPSDPTSKLRFGYVGSTDDFAVQQYIWQWGGDWTNKAGTTCTLDSPAAVKGLQWWVDLKYKDHGAPTAQQAGNLGDKVSGFRDESFAMSFMGPWAMNYTFGKSPGSTTTPVKFKWGAVVPPKGLKSNATLVASAGLVVYAKSKNKNAAWWLAKFETLGKGAQVYSAVGDDTPGALALYKNKAVKAEYGSLIGVQNQAYKTARRPVQLLRYDEFYSAVAKDLTGMWSGTDTAAVATKKACQDAQPFLNP